MEYLGLIDLRKKWGYSPSGVLKLRKKPDFPVPARIVNDGRTPLWLKSDISAYETIHPELTDKEAKRRKIRAYAICQLNKARGSR